MGAESRCLVLRGSPPGDLRGDQAALLEADYLACEEGDEGPLYFLTDKGRQAFERGELLSEEARELLAGDRDQSAA